MRDAEGPQVIWKESPKTAAVLSGRAARSDQTTPGENESPNVPLSYSSIKRRLVSASFHSQPGDGYGGHGAWIFCAGCRAMGGVQGLHLVAKEVFCSLSNKAPL